MSQRITGAEIQSVYKEESIPGQIPFAAFDEKELEKFDQSKQVDDGASYLKSVILEARKVPDIVRAEFKVFRNFVKYCFFISKF